MSYSPPRPYRMRPTRIHQIAKCCGRTFQRWTIAGNPFPTDVPCHECETRLNWKTTDGHRSPSRQTSDPDLPLNGKAKSKRIDLGLDLLVFLSRPKIQYTYQEIAAFCGCSDGAIYAIEKRALRKLRKHIDPALARDLRRAVASLP